MPGRMPDDAKEPVTMDDLLEDLKAVMRDGEELLRATEGQVGEKVAEARARAEESLGGAKERLQAARADLGTRARSAADSADVYVHANPWTAVVVAVGIGFLLGALNRRR